VIWAGILIGLWVTAIDNNMNNTGKIIAGVLLGAVLGYVTGLLVAPTSGKTARKKLEKKSKKLAKQVAGYVGLSGKVAAPHAKNGKASVAHR
jgi:gas vesicle protein